MSLGLIVLVRTFLSFSLEVEIDGVVPWHRRRSSADDGRRRRWEPARLSVGDTRARGVNLGAVANVRGSA